MEFTLVAFMLVAFTTVELSITLVAFTTNDQALCEAGDRVNINVDRHQITTGRR